MEHLPGMFEVLGSQGSLRGTEKKTVREGEREKEFPGSE